MRVGLVSYKPDAPCSEHLRYLHFLMNAAISQVMQVNNPYMDPMGNDDPCSAWSRQGLAKVVAWNSRLNATTAMQWVMDLRVIKIGRLGWKKRHEFKPKLINVEFLKGEILQLDDRFFYSSHKVWCTFCLLWRDWIELLFANSLAMWTSSWMPPSIWCITRGQPWYREVSSPLTKDPLTVYL